MYLVALFFVMSVFAVAKLKSMLERQSRIRNGAITNRRDKL